MELFKRNLAEGIDDTGIKKRDLPFFILAARRIRAAFVTDGRFSAATEMLAAVDGPNAVGIFPVAAVDFSAAAVVPVSSVEPGAAFAAVQKTGEQRPGNERMSCRKAGVLCGGMFFCEGFPAFPEDFLHFIE